MKDVDLHFHATDVELDAPENKPTDWVVRVILNGYVNKSKFIKYWEKVMTCVFHCSNYNYNLL